MWVRYVHPEHLARGTHLGVIEGSQGWPVTSAWGVQCLLAAGVAGGGGNTTTMTDEQEMVFAAVDRLNTMARAAYDGMEVQPATMYGDGLFTAEFAEGWESINFVGDMTVWCAATELCDSPENGETVDSIVAYVWMEELKDLTTLLVAFGKQCEGITP